MDELNTATATLEHQMDALIQSEPLNEIPTGNEPDYGQSDLVSSEGNPQQSEGWQSDKRYEAMWKGSPDELYKSYRNLELKLEPYQKQLAEKDQTLQQVQEQMGQFTDLQKVLEFIQQNPRYSQATNEFFDGLARQIKRDRYGDLPDEHIEKLSRIDALEAKFAEKERQAQVDQEYSLLNTSLDELSSFAESKNIDFGPQAKVEFLKYCKENDIPVRFMKSAFYEFAVPQIEKAALEKAQTQITQNSNYNRAQSIPAPQARGMAPATAGKESLDSQLDRFLTSFSRK